MLPRSKCLLCGPQRALPIFPCLGLSALQATTCDTGHFPPRRWLSLPEPSTAPKRSVPKSGDFANSQQVGIMLFLLNELVPELCTGR